MSAMQWWWIAALVLISAEILLPGFFLLWFGIAAAGVAILLMLMPDLGLLSQVLVFVVLAFVSCLGYWRVARKSLQTPAVPTLNRRAEQLIGQHYVLDRAIENGRGKAKVGDSLWLVEGPDLPAGARVTVTGVEGATLRVREATSTN
jgi:membrane protein implicated in regulation of membrane protease activity